MTHSFERYTAAGNTFLVLNTWEDPLSLSRESMRLFVRSACDPLLGVGSDGLILINQSGLEGTDHRSPRAEFRMDFYNPDGSTGMLCGNGARCAVEAAHQYGFVSGEETDFEVLGSINHAALIANGSIRVFFQDPTVIRLGIQLPLGSGKQLTANYVDLGSQHVVVFFEELARLGETDLETFDIVGYGSQLRSHEEFAPIGANANFIEVREDGLERYLRIRTFERGVEGETLACGTGCMSAAIVASLTGRVGPTPIRLLTQSGEFVTVDFKQGSDRISGLSLEGPVVRGEIGTVTFNEHTAVLEVAYE